MAKQTPFESEGAQRAAKGRPKYAATFYLCPQLGRPLGGGMGAGMHVGDAGVDEAEEYLILVRTVSGDRFFDIGKPGRLLPSFARLTVGPDRRHLWELEPLGRFLRSQTDVDCPSPRLQ